MLATPVISHGAPSSGPRPINLSKDTKQVVELLNLTFGRRGQRMLGERVSLNYASPIIMRWNTVSRGFVPGFVWEESGKIVGNVTLLESNIYGRYLVANVAVHPDYQRRGVARALMHESINFVAERLGNKILLQVERDNEAAIYLYRSLGFSTLGTMNHWYVTPSRLKLEEPVGPATHSIRRLDRHDWREAYRLDRLVVKPDLNWPSPPGPELFKTGLWRRLADFLNGQRLRGWVVDKRANGIGKREIIGLVTLFSDWGRPQKMRLRVDPAWQDQLEQELLYRALSRAKELRGGSVSISHPANDQTVNELLVATHCQLRRELTIMSLEMPVDGYN